MKVGLNYYALRLLNPVHNIYNIDVHVQLSYTWAYAGGVKWVMHHLPFKLMIFITIFNIIILFYV